LFWRIDDYVGLYFLTDIKDTEATAHFTFFDRRFKGRSGMTHRMLRHLFQRYKFQRLNVEVPVYVGENIHKFVKGLGFVREGKKRRAVEFDNKFFDVIQYGLIGEEYLTASRERWELSKQRG
jgi:RimJ/RimL family protein N-acetyltransferase